MADYTSTTGIDRRTARAIAEASSLDVSIDGSTYSMEASGANLDEMGVHDIATWPVYVRLRVNAGSVSSPWVTYDLLLDVYDLDAAPTHVKVVATVPNRLVVGNLPRLYNGTSEVSIVEALNMVAEAAGTSLSFGVRPQRTPASGGDAI